jgi:hypothetical protein
MLVLPRQGYSSKEFANFKLHTCSWQAQFNSQLKFYDCLGGLFQHGANKHKYAFEAVCITLQYAMDLGEPWFITMGCGSSYGVGSHRKPKKFDLHQTG